MANRSSWVRAGLTVTCALAIAGATTAAEPASATPDGQDGAVPWIDPPAPSWPARVRITETVTCPSRITLDATGQATAVESPGCPAPFAAVIAEAMPATRTAPLATWGHADAPSITVAKTFQWYPSPSNTPRASQDPSMLTLDAETRMVEGLPPDTTVRWTRTLAASFPIEAQQQGLTAQTCVMKVLVSAAGKVLDAAPLSCPPPFDAAARASILKWRASPVLVADAEGVWTQATLAFRAGQ